MAKSTDFPHGTPQKRLVNQSEFARVMGVSRMAVSKWKRRGWLVTEGKLVDVPASRVVIARYRIDGDRDAQVYKDPESGGGVHLEDEDEDGEEGALSDMTDEEFERQARRVDEAAELERLLQSTGTNWSLDEAKRIKESFLARRARLAYDREAGTVVPVAQVARMVAADYAKVRTRLLAIPAEHAPQIARLRTAPEVRDYLEKVVTEALKGLSSPEGEPDAPAV